MTPEQLMSTTAVNTWKLVIGRFSKALAPLTEQQLQQQVAPERNRLMYLLGHLTAVHDRMFSLLDIGERLHPELDDVYITNPDKTHSDPLSADELKQAWTEVNAKLTEAFEKLTPEEWLQKHTAVSDEDFAKDPTRNRLAILLSRTGHAAFHTGQAILVK
jgi:DinB superfamily